MTLGRTDRRQGSSNDQRRQSLPQKHVPTIAPPHDDIESRCIGVLAKGQVGDKCAEGLARLRRLAETGAASP